MQCALQIRVDCTNISNAAVSPTLYVVPVLDGVFTIERLGQCSRQIGVITSNDILDARSKPGYNWKDVEDVNGGSFLDGIKEFFSTKVLPLLKQSRLASNLASAVPFVGPALSKSIHNLGYGEGEGGCNGYGYTGGDGGVLLGSGKMTKSSLRRRLMN